MSKRCMTTDAGARLQAVVKALKLQKCPFLNPGSPVVPGTTRALRSYFEQNARLCLWYETVLLGRILDVCFLLGQEIVWDL